LNNAKESMTGKLETLEEQVVETVQKVSEPVEETANAVKETVETVKDAVEETAEAVKETVQEGMQTVRHWFDLSDHVRKRPLLMMAGAMGAGMCLEMVLGTASASGAEPSKATTHNGHHRPREKRVTETAGPSWFERFGPEIGKLKSMALSAVLGAVRQMIVQAVPQNLKEGVRTLIDNAQRKMGIDSDPEPTPSPEDQGDRNGSNTKRNPAEMGRPLGATRWSN
jgi:ElaB/YqjD/DUF883 family membrane-anchored ribosome-binding protein